MTESTAFAVITGASSGMVSRDHGKLLDTKVGTQDKDDPAQVGAAHRSMAEPVSDG